MNLALRAKSLDSSASVEATLALAYIKVYLPEAEKLLNQSREEFKEGKLAESLITAQTAEKKVREVQTRAPSDKQAASLARAIAAHLEKATKEKEKADKAREKEDAERRRVADIVGQKPPQSGWDSTVPCVKRYLEDSLKDPDSLQFINWSPVQLVNVKGQPFWRVRAKYRAKNSFGGYAIEQRLFYIRQDEVLLSEEM